MNKRFVWNFEINEENPLQLPTTEMVAQNKQRWESRFFWPDTYIITLIGLDDTFLELSRYQVKHREDTYILLPKMDYNLKIRRGQLIYKPLFKKTAQASAYGKKIKLEEQALDNILPGPATLNTRTLLTRIETHGRKISVEKEALIYPFPTASSTKLELAKLKVFNKTYFSVSIESRTLPWVESISKHLLPDQISCDYVTFLNQFQNHD